MESSSHNLVDHTSMGINSLLDRLEFIFCPLSWSSFLLVSSAYVPTVEKYLVLPLYNRQLPFLQQPVLFLDGFRNFPVQLIIVVSVKSDSESATAIYELTNWFFNVCCVVLKVVYVRSRKPIYLPLLVRDQGIEICIRLENYHPGNRIVWKPVRRQHLGTQGRMVISDSLEKNNKKKSNN